MPLLPTITALLEPLYLLLASLFFLPLTFLHHLLHLDIRTLLSPRTFQSSWFARLYKFIGPFSASSDATHIAPLLSHAHGTVLDIGPGSGLLVRYFNAQKCTRIIGVEPNKGLHADLRRRVQEAGLEGVYEVVEKGVQELDAEVAVDTVVTCKVLCSVPEPEKVVRALEAALKPGGVWLVYEHVLNGRVWWVRWWQSFLQLAWPTLIGGCNLTRSTGSLLASCADWESVDLEYRKGDNKFAALPFVTGRLVKKGGKQDAVE